MVHGFVAKDAIRGDMGMAIWEYARSKNQRAIIYSPIARWRDVTPWQEVCTDSADVALFKNRPVQKL